MRIDLHLHSTFSDGKLAPKELPVRARREGVSVIALTDHDTAAGLEEFAAACRKRNVRGIPGIELSAEYGSTLHILGYRIDTGKDGIEKNLEKIQLGRSVRNAEICTRLRKLGADISLEEVERQAGGGIVGRPHFAEVLVKKGYAPDTGAAFLKYLERGAPAYVERYRPSPSECMDIIRRSGGLAVLAHPEQTTSDAGELKLLLGELKEEGLWGMECKTSKQTAGQQFQYLSLAEEFSLFPTAGSDFHGSDHPMGISVPDDFLPWARLGVIL